MAYKSKYFQEGKHKTAVGASGLTPAAPKQPDTEYSWQRATTAQTVVPQTTPLERLAGQMAADSSSGSPLLDTLRQGISTAQAIGQARRETGAAAQTAKSNFRTRGLLPGSQSSQSASLTGAPSYRTRDLANRTEQRNENPLTLRDIGGFLKDNTMPGLDQFNAGLAKTADFVLPDFLTPKPVQKAIDYYRDTAERTSAEAAQKNQERFGNAGVTAGNLYQGTVAAVPQLVAALVTGGASAVKDGTQTLMQAGTKLGLGQAVQNFLKNPQFWFSFAQTVGSDYEDAKASGANELQAQTAAIAGSLLNAGIEIGGGLEGMNRVGRFGVGDWLKSAAEEGLEEVEQGIVSNLVNKAVFDPGKELFSLENENAVVNPSRAAMEFAGGAVAGGLLSGGTAVVNHAVNALGTNGQKNYQYLKERDGGKTPDFDRQYEHYYNQARAGLAEDKIAPYPTQNPLDEPARQSALYAGENDGKTEAAETVQTILDVFNGKMVSDKALDRALSFPESRKAIEQVTGKLPETPSQARKTVRDWIANAQKMQDSGSTSQRNGAALAETADQLLREYESRADKKALRGQLQALYDHAADGADADALQAEASGIAESILRQSEHRDDTLSQEYKGLRDELRNTKITLGEQDRGSLPDGYSTFRRQNFGQLRVVREGGVPVDTMYEQLRNDYGEAFFPAEITHPADQLSRMAEVLDSLKPAVENPYARDMGGAVQQLTEEILSASGVQAQSVETWTAGTRDTAQAAEPDGIRDAAPGLFETEVSRNMKTEDREFLHMLFEAVGVRGAIVSQESSVENAHIEDGVITVFANADDAASAYRGTVQHEITHRIKELGAAAYQAYEDFAVAQLTAQNNVQAESLIEATQAYYKEAAGQELTEAQAREELAGMYAMSLNLDTETVRQFVRQSGQNQQTAKGILQTIRDILRSIREKFTGRSLNREQQGLVQRLSEGERLWAEALGEASQLANGNAAQTDGGTRYSIKRAADGSQYVEVEEDIFDGHDDIDFENITSGSLKKIGKVLSGIVETQFSERIDANGQMIGVNKKTAQEWARSKSASRLSRKHPQRFQDKMRAFANADEILQAATDYVGEKPEHPRHDNFTEFSRGTVLLKIGGRGYEAKVIVGITKNGGANLYDVLSLTPTTIEEAPINTTTAAQNATNRRHGTSSENSIADSGENVNYDILYMNQKTDASYSPTVQGAVEDDTSVKESIADPGENINPEKKFSLKNAAEAVKKLAQYREQYGALPRGENAVRDILFPQRTTKDTRVRRFSRTAAESATLTDGQADAIGAAVAEGRFNYEPIGDRAARKHAEDMLARGEKAASDAWAQVVARDGRAGKNDIALGEYLLREAAKAGDTGRVVQLTAEIAAEGTRAGQIVQAMRLLKKLDGAGQLVALDATLKKLQGELDRGKSRVFLEVPEALREKLAAAKGETEINAVLDEIYTELAKQIPTTWADKWNAWRYLSMLGNPRTHIRNVLGNAAFEPAILVKNTVGTALEHVFLPRGKRTKSLSGLLPRTGGEAMRFAQSDFREMKELITGGGKMNPTDIIRERQRVFKMGWLEWLRKQNFNFLEAEDGVFLEHHYVRAMTQYLKANQIDVKALDADSAEGAKVLNRAREYAVREAQKATYRDFSQTAQVISQAARKMGSAGRVLIEGILPFKKTPINVLKRGVEYSPIGLAKAVTYDANRLRKGKISGSEFIDSLSAGLTGTGIAALGWLLARCGVLVGGGGDDKEQDFRDALGAQSWALKIGDRTFTIDWLAPSSMPLFVGAEAQRLCENGVELNGRSVMDAALSIAEPMTQMSMLDGLNSMLSSVRYGENPLSDLFTGAVTDYVNQAVPTLLGQIARTIDPVRRTTYDDKNSGIPSIAQKTLQTNQNKIPFLSQRSAAYLDIWGREQFSGSIAERALQNFVSPGYLRNEKLSDMESELIRLYQATGDGSALPGRAAKSFAVGEGDDRVTKYLTADEYQLFAETRGTLMYSGLSEITSSSYYAALDDVGKLDAVSKMIELSNAVAKTGVSDYELKSWYAKANDGREQYGIRFSDFVLAYAAQSGTESLKDKDGDTITNSGSLRQMQAVYAVPGLSDKQRAYLFEACGVGKSVRHYNRVKVDEELRKMEQKAKK